MPLLSAIFGGNTVNPAAGAVAVQPEDALANLNKYRFDDPKDYYQSVDDAIKSGENIKPDVQYYSPQDGSNVTKYVKSPDDLLPMKKPGFFQRAFAPIDAERANSINTAYATQPMIARQADRTQSQIGATHAAGVQSIIGKPLGAANPTDVYWATGGDPSLERMEGAETAGRGLDKGIPSATVNTGLSELGARNLGAQNTTAQEAAFADQGGPGIAASADIQGLRTGRAQNSNAYDAAARAALLQTPALSSDVANKGLQVQGGNLGIDQDTLANRRIGAINATGHEAEMQKFGRTLEPLEENTAQNEAAKAALTSPFGNALAPRVSKVTYDTNGNPTLEPAYHPPGSMYTGASISAPYLQQAAEQANQRMGVGTSPLPGVNLINKKTGKPFIPPPSNIGLTSPKTNGMKTNEDGDLIDDNGKVLYKKVKD